METADAGAHIVAHVNHALGDVSRKGRTQHAVGEILFRDALSGLRLGELCLYLHVFDFGQTAFLVQQVQTVVSIARLMQRGEGDVVTVLQRRSVERGRALRPAHCLPRRQTPVPRYLAWRSSTANRKTLPRFPT